VSNCKILVDAAAVSVLKAENALNAAISTKELVLANSSAFVITASQANDDFVRKAREDADKLVRKAREDADKLVSEAREAADDIEPREAADDFVREVREAVDDFVRQVREAAAADVAHIEDRARIHCEDIACKAVKLRELVEEWTLVKLLTQSAELANKALQAHMLAEQTVREIVGIIADADAAAAAAVNKCTICMQVDANVVYQTCHHMCICSICSERVIVKSTCPICRADQQKALTLA
jgi:vacuolar-type H+-ATPase subunit H